MTRREFTKETKRAALKRSGGVCECHLMPWIFPVACGLKLGHGNTFFEHVNPDGAGGGNDLGNAAALVKTCWKKKTATFDARTVAKVIRQKDFQNGTYTPTSRPLSGGRNTPFKIKMNRTVVSRSTGEPVRR